MTSYDRLNPSLFESVAQARQRFDRGLIDTAWREERLLRYHYWLLNGAQHAAFNLYVSWANDDLAKERELWNSLDPYDDPDHLSTVLRERAEQAYGVSCADAIKVCTNPALADAGLPIWHAGTGTCLPQTMGHLRLTGATDYESNSPGAGWGFSYRADGEALDIYLYTRGLHGIQQGVDRLVEEELFRSFDEFRLLKGATEVTSEHEPKLIRLQSKRDTLVEVASVSWNQLVEGDSQYSSLGVTGFVDHFLKMRYSVSDRVMKMEGFDDRAAEMNKAIADFYEFFCR